MYDNLVEIFSFLCVKTNKKVMWYIKKKKKKKKECVLYAN